MDKRSPLTKNWMSRFGITFGGCELPIGMVLFARMVARESVSW